MSTQTATTTPATAKANVMQVLQQTSPSQLANLPVLEERFVTLYEKTQGVAREQAEMAFAQEKYHFQKALSENASLRECETLSLYGCFMDAAVQGLSFDPKKKLAYLIPGNVNVGTHDEKKYVKRAALEISPYGELAIRMQMGQVKHVDNPVIVYEGDTFEPHQDASGKGVNYILNINHGTRIIGAFIRIVRNDGTEDYHWMLPADWQRLAGYSEKKNFGKANALYASANGGIDPGFLGAKLIKHAFKSYPKVKLVTTFSKIQQDPEEPTPAPLSHEEMYGLPASALPTPADEAVFTPTMIVSPAEPVNMEGLSDEAKAGVINATAQPMTAQPHKVDLVDNGEGF